MNTGPVVAGSIGGAGRLNFSVIGDAVNVAARVEAATREIGDDVLITEETADRMNPEIEVESCGERTLKGLDQPVTLLSPRVEARTAQRPARSRCRSPPMPPRTASSEAVVVSWRPRAALAVRCP